MKELMFIAIIAMIAFTLSACNRDKLICHGMKCKMINGIDYCDKSTDTLGIGMYCYE